VKVWLRIWNPVMTIHEMEVRTSPLHIAIIKFDQPPPPPMEVRTSPLHIAIIKFDQPPSPPPLTALWEED
jgi:hypothetical protein